MSFHNASRDRKGTDNVSLLTSAICEAKFGQPTPEMERKWMGVFSTGVERQKSPLLVIPLRIYCHKLLIDPLREAIDLLCERQLGNQIKTWDGCFNIRTKKGSTSRSLHSWGLAVDINAAWNRFGAEPTLSPEVVACFTEAGFNWGGEWKVKDGMHFELQAKLVSKSVP